MHRWSELGGEVFEELAGAAKPGTLEAALVTREHWALVEDLLGPLAGLGGAAFGGQQIGEVQIGLRRGRPVRDLAEEGFGFVILSGLRVGVSEQAGGAVEVVARLPDDDVFEVGQRSRGIIQEQSADAAAIEGIERIGAGGDGVVERGPCQDEFAVVHVEVAELFKDSGRAIVAHQDFELANALATGKTLSELRSRPRSGTASAKR